MHRILSYALALFFAFAAPGAAQETAAPTTDTVETEPANAVGVPTGDGRLDYGSPTVEQTLAAPHLHQILQPRPGIRIHHRETNHGRRSHGIGRQK